jgi:hypothetical protein
LDLSKFFWKIPFEEGYGVYTCLVRSEIGVNPPNPLKKGAKIRSLVPLKKGDLGGFRSRNEAKQTCVYTVASERRFYSEVPPA